MRKFIIPTMLIATLALSACAAQEPSVPETTISAETEAETEQTAESTETEESAVDENNEELSVDAIVTEKATYVENSDFGENQLLFENADGGQFICNVSSLTDLAADLEDGKEYLISHSQVMAMSYPGIYPQVYGIREADSEMIDTMATLDEINEDAKELLFTGTDGTQFLTDLDDASYETGKQYVVTHDGMMTRSLPGKYMNVTRILDVEAALAE